MTKVRALYDRMIQAMEVPGLHIPLTAAKFFRNGDAIPSGVMDCHPDDLTLTSCQAAKQAALGDAVLLTVENIGCIAAAISFGLVDKDHDAPLGGSRVYTDIMRGQSGLGGEFRPPTPKDFTEGTVYACGTSGHSEFCLFGKQDSGRFKDPATARLAMADMLAIQPPTTKGVLLFSLDFDEAELTPDVVVLSVRAVELTRIIQAYQYNTGKRVTASMGGLRGVNSDLIVRPYLTQDINVSTYCLGARLIAQYDADRLGIGMPFGHFEEVVRGMEASRTGFPFASYPGTAPRDSAR